jgi:hypothetical protein
MRINKNYNSHRTRYSMIERITKWIYAQMRTQLQIQIQARRLRVCRSQVPKLTS